MTRTVLDEIRAMADSLENEWSTRTLAEVCVSLTSLNRYLHEILAKRIVSEQSANLLSPSEGQEPSGKGGDRQWK